MVYLPRYFPAALSQVLGTIIADRLPTQQSSPWRKALGAWDNRAKTPSKRGLSQPFPSGVAWPIETVLFVYPGKRTYNQGELILWELKLLQDHADHGLFLELILPAMEEAASTSDPRWHSLNGLWGRFDIHAVYAARGACWEPVVDEGRLDLSYRADPTQWAEELSFGVDLKRGFRRLTWVTPVDLGRDDETTKDRAGLTSDGRSSLSEEPTLRDILDALMGRMVPFLSGKNRSVEDVRALLSPDDQAAIQSALQQTRSIASRDKKLEPAPRGWPGRWIGTQAFNAVPSSLFPYLELASILHIGRETHLGCGTFVLS